MVEGGAGDVQDLGDRGLGDILAQQRPDVLLLAVEPGCSQGPLGPAEQFPLGFGSGESFLGPFRDQVPLDLGKQSEQGDHDLGLQVLLAVELDGLLDGDEADLAMDQGLHDLDHLREAAAEPRQLADQQAVAGLERPQHFVDAALERTLARRDAGLDELVDREAAFLAELEDRQLLVGEVLRTSGDAEVSDGFQGGVQEKVKWGLFRTVKDYSIQNIV